MHILVFLFFNFEAKKIRTGFGDERLYCASADWMDRNLFHRVEVAFPIEDSRLAKQVYQDGLINYLKDNTQAWTLSGDGRWQQNQPAAGETPHIAQEHLLKMINGVGEPA